MTDLNLRAARIQPRGIVAISIAVAITAGEFALSFAMQRDVALQAGIPHSLAWIFPVTVDGAILGATIAVVALRMINRNDGRRNATATHSVGSARLSLRGVRSLTTDQ